jgi:CubicO group peptidase (beta-lactamase class C family)
MKYLFLGLEVCLLWIRGFFLVASTLLPICHTALGSSELTIRSAVEVSFPVDPLSRYQLQTSDDLSSWTNDGQTIAGSGGLVTRVFQVNKSRQFYRLISSNLVDISESLNSVRATYNIPALGCLVIADGKVAALGAVGTRKHGVDMPVNTSDLWHQGSITKSMTATLAALLVQEGKISWKSTLSQVFPEKVSAMAAAWRGVTLEQLLTHTSGAPADTSGIWNTLWNFGGTPRDARVLLFELVTASAPVYTPGTGFLYSNAGFAMAGAMLEKVSNKAWEDLVTEKLFIPLGMTNTGFGVPGTPRYIFQPWGHTLSGGTNIPMAPGTNADAPPAFGPAGLVHAPLLDLASYVQLHLSGARGEQTALLTPELFSKLHTGIANNNYSMGWFLVPTSWAKGSTLTHSGSNTYWQSNIWIAPARNWACVVVTNSGSADAFNATEAMVSAMVQKFGLN